MQKKQEYLENEQLNRLMQHAMHAQNRFDSRLNFFLIFESVLLGVVTTLYSKAPSIKPILITVTCLGFFLTILWGYTQIREKFLFEVVEKRLAEELPEYQETFRRQELGRWPFPSTFVLTYGVPGLIASVWIILFVFAVQQH